MVEVGVIFASILYVQTRKSLLSIYELRVEVAWPQVRRSERAWRYERVQRKLENSENLCPL